MRDLRGVGTFVEEGQSFARRHEAELGPTASVWGGLVYGLMRALAECPACPGTFRVPLDADWRRLACRRCGGVWEQLPAAETTIGPASPNSKNRRRTGTRRAGRALGRGPHHTEPRG